MSTPPKRPHDAPRPEEDEALDEALDESFPASDPPSMTDPDHRHRDKPAKKP